MLIRELSPEDVAAYAQLRLESLQKEPFAFGRSPEEHLSLSLDEVAARLQSIPNEKFSLGAFDDTQLIGTVTFMRENAVKERHKGRVFGVYIAHAHRRQGIGHQLIAALLAKARAVPGLEQLLLAVTSPQTAALQLYRKAGFVSFGTEPRALKVGEQYIDAEHMLLILTPPE